MTEQIRVAVQGALGRMGQEIIATLAKEPDMLPVGGMDKFATVELARSARRLRHDPDLDLPSRRNW